MNLKQHAFVTEYLRFGCAQTAYRNAYKCYQSPARSIESAGNRLLKNPEVAQAIHNAQSRIRSEVEQELKEQLKYELLTLQRKREILSMIAQGDIYIEQNYKGKDCRTCTQLVKPTINQMLKAIDLDSKLAGHYATKKQQTVVHTAPVKQKEEVEIVAEQTNTDISQQNTTITTPVKDAAKSITHAGLRKLLSTPVKQPVMSEHAKEILIE